ncbi:PQQ-dependent sugar dehydrogenase [Dokdonella sp. MW10]|uniref:PQQ-dependent sugar dehydrogenase n=1 Tax=Dokdonella sp. MW10 TaxID=2992926 RepID=UPI003F7FFEFD
MTRHTLLALALVGTIGCGSKLEADAAAPKAAAKAEPSSQTSTKGTFRVVEVANGLAMPWAVAFLPDGRYLVTERAGVLRIVGADGSVSKAVTGVPAVFAESQGGLLDVVLSPSFAQDGLVYLSYAEPGEGGKAPAGTAVARGKLDGEALTGVEVIYRQAPKLSKGHHFGSRLVFDDQGFLFVTQGEHNERATSQDLDKLQGKLVRLNADGSVPQDNPFVGRDGVRAEIFSYGHRNMQGAALHPVTRKLWTSEHGPKGGDEVNIPEAGKNYGWPVITYGVNYSGLKIPEAEGTEKEGLEQPHHYWAKSPALSGMAFANAPSAWKGNLFLGALSDRNLIRLELDGDRIAGEERLLGDLGARIRDVREGPDGNLYVLTEDANGKLLRLEPPKA